MANMLRTGAQWMAEKLRAHVSDRYLYETDSEQFEVDATPTEPRIIIDGQAAVLVDADARDFLVPVEDMRFASGSTEPSDGHKLREIVGGAEVTYELRPPAQNARCWEQNDAYGVMLRLHTKKVAS